MSEAIEWLAGSPGVIWVILTIVLIVLGVLLGIVVAAYRDGRKIKLFGFSIGRKHPQTQQGFSPSEKVRLFVTTPVSGFGTQNEYEDFMDRLRPILKRLRQLDKVTRVYLYNEHISSIDELKASKINVPDYLAEIQEADYLILIVETGSLSSVYFEAGYALGLRTSSIYFVVGPKGRLPYLMKQSTNAFPKHVRMCDIESLEEIPEYVRAVI